MKPEPLKNKWHFGDELLESGDRYYKEKSVRSAVEWVIKRINEDEDMDEISKDMAITLILVGFEDVVEEEGEK